MNATSILPPAMHRASLIALSTFRTFLMLAGLFFVVGLAGQLSGRFDLIDSLRDLMPAGETATVAAVADDEAAEVAEPAAEPAEATTLLSPQMRGALGYVARRYKVSTEALQPIFATAQAIGHDLRLDPLLIIAVIGVESGFNPFSQSVVGAQGLMQVVPRFHLDKLPELAAPAAFLDPVTNVQVGARVLKESIRRNGGLEEGLQQFGGAIGDPERRYSSRVLAERQRLEQAAAQRPRTT